MAVVALVIAAIAGFRALRRSNEAPATLSTGARAMALALGLPAFPLVPIACQEAQVNIDDGLISALAWLSVLFFVSGCAWLRWGARPDPAAPP